MQKVHFIAIGGSVMHNLAIAMHEKGFEVSGSDDEVYEPAAGRLKEHGLLPQNEGWFPEKVNEQLDAVILGMHARPDNPELEKAKSLGIKIYAYPEYILTQALDKQRIVIAGSHGKTTITAMIMHVLKQCKRDFDYVIGAQVEGFDTNVKLTNASIIIIEGDEYLSSPINRTPKFLNYSHHIGLISGIAWDHINVYPTIDEYVKQFDLFADATPKAGTLIYCEEDDLVTVIGSKERDDVSRLEYKTHKHKVKNGITYLQLESGELPITLIGKHNMQNLNGAKAVLKTIGITNDAFYKAIATFGGASKRLEKIAERGETVVYKDFAHAPSKLKATTEALKEQYPDRRLIACMELHTFSSLNKKFIEQYKDTFQAADRALVYYNPKTIAHKKLEDVSVEEVKSAFNRSDLMVFTDSQKMQEILANESWQKTNLLLMSSGTFDGIDIQELAKSITKQ